MIITAPWPPYRALKDTNWSPVQQPGERVVLSQVAQLGLGLLGVVQRTLDDLAILGVKLRERRRQVGIALLRTTCVIHRI
jgi:hypothetical protein